MTSADPMAVERVNNDDSIMTEVNDAITIAATTATDAAAVTTTSTSTGTSTTTNAVTPSKKTQQQQQGEEVFSPELLKIYYDRLFPYSLLCKWLSYDPSFAFDDKTNKTVGEKKIFSRREFSFTLETPSREEIYIRYQSFSDLEGLKSAVTRQKPRKIDIGAVFSHPPKDKNAYVSSSSNKNTGFRPVQRELVFDIDLTDYDDVRKCGCQNAKICRTCWTFMTAALKVLDQGLREDFGFQHIAWFYSGRRGIHAWVCDEEARNLSDEARSAVANYFEISLTEGLLGNRYGNNSSGTVHPMLTRAYDVLEPYFCRYVLPDKVEVGGGYNNNNNNDDSSASEMIGGHKLLADRDSWEKHVLDTLPTVAKESVGKRLKEKWSNPRELNDLSPVDKWNTLLRHLRVKFKFPQSWPSSSSSYDDYDEDENSNNNKNNNKRSKANNSSSSSSLDSETLKVWMWPMEIVFKYTYPRLDINVSKMQNHLLKSPFCVHPKTGRVCVPIDPDAMDINNDFNPFAVPTIAQLATELNEYHKNNTTSNKNDDDVDEEEEGDDGNGNDENDTRKKTKKIVVPQHEWEKTSLKGYFEIFEKKFLQPLEKEWRREQRDLAEQQAAIRGDF